MVPKTSSNVPLKSFMALLFEPLSLHTFEMHGFVNTLRYFRAAGFTLRLTSTYFLRFRWFFRSINLKSFPFFLQILENTLDILSQKANV